MSANFMFAIALMYAGAGVSFFIDGKYLWFVLAFCWGIGNAILALISLRPQ
jgi:hypothetical protein